MISRAEKFRELILYIARESSGDPRCGATKLNKILFYADFRAYRVLGRPISGQKYQKLERGPSPKHVVPVISEMEADGLCRWEERDYFGFPLKKLVPLRDPDLSVLSEQEVQISQPRFKAELEPILAGNPQATEAWKGLTYAVSRLPENGMAVQGRPGFYSRPFHTEGGSFLAVYGRACVDDPGRVAGGGGGGAGRGVYLSFNQAWRLSHILISPE